MTQQTPEAFAATALDPAQVVIGSANGPGIYVATAGTAVPALTVTAWPTPWTLLGYLSDDGPTIAQAIDTESITPWQSITPIRTIITGRALTLQFVMWQIVAQNAAMYFGQAVPTETAGAFHLDIRSDRPQPRYAIGIDAYDGGRAYRLGFGSAVLSDNGDMQIQRSAPIPLDVTLSALSVGGLLGTLDVGAATQALEAPMVSGSGEQPRRQRDRTPAGATA